jgi:hypothetical protein
VGRLGARVANECGELAHLFSGAIADLEDTVADLEDKVLELARILGAA